LHHFDAYLGIIEHRDGAGRKTETTRIEEEGAGLRLRAASLDLRAQAAPPKGSSAMTDATTAKTKAGKPAPVVPMFEMPKFEMPKFDMPKFEIPAAFRELAEKGLSQAKENYEKMKTAAEEATDMLEDTYTTAAKGASEYNLKVIESARANANAMFDYAKELLDAKSLSDLVELSTAHARKQFETLTSQTKELTALAQKVATDTAEPVKSGVTKAFKQVA
jgi:phasin